MKNYDYLIVGSGLFGATFSRLATDNGKRCLVIDKRSHTGGNVYCENVAGINVHQYGPHIFHTSDKKVWEFVNRLSTIRHADQIVVMDKGQIVEVGNHEMLMEYKGFYFTLISSQNENLMH